jgi:hypothetical protein
MLLSILLAGMVIISTARAADLIVSANDGKYGRVKGASTYPQPAPSDSLAVIDAPQFPPVLKSGLEGIEHTIAGPSQAVAATPDGNLAVIGAPSKYDHDTRKQTFGTFPDGVSISPTGEWIAIQSLNGSNLTPSDPGPGRQTLARVTLSSLLKMELRHGSTNLQAARRRKGLYLQRATRPYLCNSTSRNRSPSIRFKVANLPHRHSTRSKGRPPVHQIRCLDDQDQPCGMSVL